MRFTCPYLDSYPHHHQRDIADSGGIEALVAILQDSVGSEKAQFNAARALRNLAMNHDDNAAKIVEGGGLAALRMLAREGSPRGKKNAARVLRCLTSPRLGGGVDRTEGDHVYVQKEAPL